MNTKQVLYNALKSQLDAKKADGDKYNDEVYTPAINELKSRVNEWLYQNTDITANEVTFQGNGIEFTYGNEHIKRINISVKHRYDSKPICAELSWRSGEYSKYDSDYRNYLHDLGVLTNEFDKIETKLFEWRDENNAIEKAAHMFHEDYNTLNSALNKLSTEISTDVRESMKQLGFEIKTFKQTSQLDWNYKDSEKEYQIIRRDKTIQLQYGRSQYDTTWVCGFKVLGKKGNKYKVEVYREGREIPQEYSVLEKKFESFIENAHYWENSQADHDAERVQRQYNERTANLSK